MQAPSQSSPAARTSFEAPFVSAVQTSDSFKSTALLEPALSLAHGAGLAHDAGNLFGALGLYCDLLAAPGVLRPEHRHYVTELRQLTGRSSALVQELLTGASYPATTDAESLVGEAARASRQLAPLVEAPDAAATLREIEPLLSAIAGASVTVICKAPRALPTPHFQPECLERILVNLVRNASQAIDHTSPRRHGNIRIALATVAGQLRLTVEDNGPGMPVITAAAFLSPSPLPMGATRGLGHRIVHELVTASKGTLNLRVRPGRGTTINILWPVSAKDNPVQPIPAVNSSRRLGAATC